jgi:hypothetical protein
MKAEAIVRKIVTTYRRSVGRATVAEIECRPTGPGAPTLRDNQA